MRVVAKKHPYGALSVFERGIPLRGARNLPVFKADPDPFTDTYKQWLHTPDYETAQVRLASWAHLINAILQEANPDTRLTEVDGVSVINAVVGGSHELAVIEILQSWDSSKAERQNLQSRAALRLKHIHSLIHIAETSTDAEGADQTPTTYNSLLGWKTVVGEEALKLSAHKFAAHSLGDLLTQKTGPPSFGPRHIRIRAFELASCVSEIVDFSKNKITDHETKSSLNGLILEIEMLIAVLLGSTEVNILQQLGPLWPTLASQRLDYGKYRDDNLKTDMVVFVPRHKAAIPIQIKSSDHYYNKKGDRCEITRTEGAVNLLEKDLYPKTRKLKVGDFSAYVLDKYGAKNNANESSSSTGDLYPERIKFIASKLVEFARGVEIV